MKILKYHEFANKVDNLINKELNNSNLKELELYRKNLAELKRKKFLNLFLLFVFIFLFFGITILLLILFINIIFFTPLILFLILIISFVITSKKASEKYKQILNNPPDVLGKKLFLKAISCDQHFTYIPTSETEEAFKQKHKQDFKFEFLVYSIPSQARLVMQQDVLEFYSTDKFQDKFILSYYKFHWIEKKIVYSTVTNNYVTRYIDVYREFYELKHLINPNNFVDQRDVNYSIFSSSKSNIELESSEFNSKFNLQVDDQIKGRMLFTPYTQFQMLNDINNSIINTFCVEKKGNLIKIVFTPLKDQFEFFKSSYLVSENLKNSIAYSLKKDTYALIELLRFSIYKGRQDDFSY
ncbi:hypothetical protein QLQ80_02910 [Mycoplasma sp. M5725]|uniref:DUF3137 domain-containing protein n=1 Tax=Mycoplasma phocimorsus TaxID=3045839 RepID=A0AAJ1PSN9_9MOLU|nr:hypothetical protein [Mycoplasma phocimorsus]MDJ1646013.1 hypothetical protein [Mycoplasma phocimorsus]